ncbi:hypothetical protein LIS04_205 [Listeria phage LIS04]|nr:hypothetical protein LIS04_205 [Listeria phage LIS04]
MKNATDMYYKFDDLKLELQTLSSIVQNDGMKLSKSQVNNWSDQYDHFITKLVELGDEVTKFYLTEEGKSDEH